MKISLTEISFSCLILHLVKFIREVQENTHCVGILLSCFIFNGFLFILYMKSIFFIYSKILILRGCG